MTYSTNIAVIGLLSLVALSTDRPGKRHRKSKKAKKGALDSSSSVLSDYSASTRTSLSTDTSSSSSERVLRSSLRSADSKSNKRVRIIA